MLSIALVSETDGSVLEVVHALEHDTVERVKLRLRARGCHKIADGQLVCVRVSFYEPCVPQTQWRLSNRVTSTRPKSHIGGGRRYGAQGCVDHEQNSRSRLAL